MSMAPSRKKDYETIGGGLAPTRKKYFTSETPFVAPEVVNGRLTSQEDFNYLMGAMRGDLQGYSGSGPGGRAGGSQQVSGPKLDAMNFLGENLPELRDALRRSTGDRIRGALPALAMLAGPFASIAMGPAMGIGAGVGAGTPALSNVAGQGLPTALSSGAAAAPGAYGAMAGGAQMFGQAGGTAAALGATSGGTSLSNMAPANVPIQAPITNLSTAATAADKARLSSEVPTTGPGLDHLGPSGVSTTPRGAPPVDTGPMPPIRQAPTIPQPNLPTTGPAPTYQAPLTPTAGPSVSSPIPSGVGNFDSLVPNAGNLDLSSFPAADTPFNSGMGYGAGGGLDPAATGANGMIPPSMGGTSAPGLTMPTDPSVLGSFGGGDFAPSIPGSTPSPGFDANPALGDIKGDPSNTVPTIDDYNQRSAIERGGTQTAADVVESSSKASFIDKLSAAPLDTLGDVAERYGPVVFAGIEYNDRREASDAYEEQLNTIIEQSDPFGGERAYYQNLLQQHLANPDDFLNSPQIKFAAQAAARKFASMGYNMSPAQGTAIAEASIGQYYNQANLLAGLAGSQFRPDSSAIGNAYSRTVGAGYDQSAAGINVARQLLKLYKSRNDEDGISSHNTPQKDSEKEGTFLA